MERPRTPTPLTEDDVARLLVEVYPQEYGEQPTQQRAEMLISHLWLENGRGKHVIQYNHGNLSGESPLGNWYASEVQREGAPALFKAWDNHAEGMRGYLHLLSHDRYKPLLAAADAGDPEAFARQTFDTGYCTDQACRDAGPTYASLGNTIREKDYPFLQSLPLGDPVFKTAGVKGGNAIAALVLGAIVVWALMQLGGSSRA